MATTKTLRVGILTRISTLNPREVRDLVATQAVSQVFDTPFATPRGDLAPPPVVFAGPLQAESPLVYTAALRPGLVFSDGTPLLASHVANSLSRVTAVREHATVEARGERVVFTLQAPVPRLDLLLTLVHTGIALEKGPTLVGSGPFMVAPAAGPDEVRLVRNPHARVRAALDEIVFKVYPPDKDGAPDRLVAAIEQGEVDFTNMLSRTDATHIGGVRKLFQPSNSTAILYINTERPELANPEVRRALACAINRLAITEVSYMNALAFAASNLLPPMMATPRESLGFDLQKAKALLAQPGLVKPTRLRLLTVWAPRPYLPNPQPVAELIAKQLAELGITVTVVAPRNSEEFYAACERGDYDMVLGGWIADTPDAADFLEANLRSDRISRPGMRSVASVNRARFKHAPMDAALKRFREDPSPDNRENVLKLVADQAPLLPLMYGPMVVVSAWRVKNVEVSPLGVPQFAAFDLDA